MNRVVVIGSSTGGPGALEEVFRALPGGFGVPILIAQHLTKQFTATLADRLNKTSELTVVEAENGISLETGWAYVIPGDSHFFISNPGPTLTLLPAADLPKPSVDMGLTSAAEHFGPGTIAVILTGMGDDGLIGARAVQQVGGRVIVQDETTSKVYGMPKVVKEAGLADEVLPLSKIAGRLQVLV